MRVDVFHVGGGDACPIQRHIQRLRGTDAVRTRCGQMKSIACTAITGEFRQYRGASFQSAFHLFQNQDACAFSQNQAVPPGIERTAGFSG